MNKFEELNNEYSNSPIKSGFLFRGMENCNYKLLPSIYRDVENQVKNASVFNSKYLAFTNERSILENFIQDASAYVTQLNNDNYVRWAELAQHYDVPTRFLDWTENPLVALYFACESNKSCDSVVWMLHKRNYLFYANQHDKNCFNYRATNEEVVKALLTTPATDGIQYSKLLEMPVIYTPYYLDDRMSAQASWFMAWGKEKRAFEE